VGDNRDGGVWVKASDMGREGKTGGASTQISCCEFSLGKEPRKQALTDNIKVVNDICVVSVPLLGWVLLGQDLVRSSGRLRDGPRGPLLGTILLLRE
jgi:hypothetical protein